MVRRAKSTKVTMLVVDEREIHVKRALPAISCKHSNCGGRPESNSVRGVTSAASANGGGGSGGGGGDFTAVSSRLDTGLVRAGDGCKRLPALRQTPRVVTVTTSGRVISGVRTAIPIPERIRSPRYRFTSSFDAFKPP